MVNLTHPVLLLYREEEPTDPHERKNFLNLLTHQQVITKPMSPFASRHAFNLKMKVFIKGIVKPEKALFYATRGT
jgi:hypothetical protein